MKNKIFLTIAIVIMILIILIALLLTSSEEEEGQLDLNEPNSSENQTNIEITELTNHSKYFIINEILTNYYKSINSKNEEKIFNYLSLEFIEKEGVNYNNIENKVQFYEKNYSYNITEIKTARISNSYIAYILKTDLIENAMDEILVDEKITTYHIIFLDEKNFTFSIYPIDKHFFDQEKLNTDEFKYDSITKNNYNNYNIINISNSLIVDMYFQNLKYTYYYLNDKTILENITEELKINELSIIRKYNIDENYKKIIIYDNYDQEITFNISSVLNYTVDIN